MAAFWAWVTAAWVAGSVVVVPLFVAADAVFDVVPEVVPVLDDEGAVGAAGLGETAFGASLPPPPPPQPASRSRRAVLI